MNAVFLKLLNMSLTASLLILAVLPVRLLMKKAPKWMTCLLWLIVAVALICPVRFESPVSVLPVADPIVITSDKPQTNDTLPLYQEEPILIQDIVEQDNSPTKPDYLKIGSTVWCIGMAALLGCAIFSWLRLKRRVAVSIEIGKNVYLCDDIDSPFILGIIRPHIYLPSALDTDTVPQVLIHEQAHLARKDHWWKPLGYLLLTLHWFNPLVWAAYSLLCTDIELACDEKVIKGMDTDSKQAYSEALLRCSIPRHLIAACPLAFGEVSVKQRISAVLHYKKPAFWVILIAVVVCVALCMGFLTDPKIITLGDLNSTAVADIESISVDGTLYTDLNALSNICDLLSNLKLQERTIRPNVTQTYKNFHILRKNNAGYCMLSISPDGTKLILNYTITSDDPQVVEKYYKILNPELLLQIDFSHFTQNQLNSATGNTFTAEKIKSAIETFLNTASLDASNADFSDEFFEFDTFHCTAFMTYITKNGVTSHKAPLSLTLSYKDSLFVVEELEGENEIEAFLLTKDPISVSIFQSNDTATLEFRGEVILNPETGEILSIVSYPMEQGSDIVLPFAIYPDMDDSFRGHEALYFAIKTNAELNADEWSDPILAGNITLEGKEYAAIRSEDSRDAVCMLIEYEQNRDGTVTVLNHDTGSPPESLGKYGYSMNHCIMSNKTLYWTLFTDERWETTKDGTETDTTQTVPTDYTGFRFIWADLHQEEYSAEGSFFLAKVNSVIPPAISIPMVGDNTLTALGWRLP